MDHVLDRLFRDKLALRIERPALQIISIFVSSDRRDGNFELNLLVWSPTVYYYYYYYSVKHIARHTLLTLAVFLLELLAVFGNHKSCLFRSSMPRPLTLIGIKACTSVSVVSCGMARCAHSPPYFLYHAGPRWGQLKTQVCCAAAGTKPASVLWELRGARRR